jgi:hypothetical protein
MRTKVKRPPDRKLLLAALMLLVAAGAALSRPAIGITQQGEIVTAIFKLLGRSGF